VVQRRRVDNTWPVAALTASSEARYRLRIVISAYSPAFNAPVRGRGGSRQNIAMPFRKKKTRMVWLPDGEKFLKIHLFVLTESTSVTERQTYTHTQMDTT